MVMAHEDNSTLTIGGATGTSSPIFYVTGIAEYWQTEESQEDKGVFTKEKFEQALKKVSQRKPDREQS
jgi:hypothetical protein